MLAYLALLATLSPARDTLAPEALPPAELIIDGRLPNGASVEATRFHLGPPDSTAVIYNEVRGDTGYVEYRSDLVLEDCGGTGALELQRLRFGGSDVPGGQTHYCSFAGFNFTAATTLDSMRRIFPESMNQSYVIKSAPGRYRGAVATVVPVSLSREVFTDNVYHFIFVAGRLTEMYYLDYP